ncbi:MAG: glutamate synthase subunit beta, partial [Leucobacter sp.]|nr:glutamate synthase subunit beta [Leucobacter sp.]
NNFPEFTGRVCPAPCESACVLGINQPAVTIKQIECSLIDQGFEQGWVVPMPPERLSGKTVAVVGSGPAGLAAAQQLTRAGHTVAVYERDEQPGGLLRFGIPDFKLEKSLVERRVEQMRLEGTRFRCGIEIGRDMSWSELRRRYDAVVVATGAVVPRPLDLPGRELSGIHYAMDYLTAQNRATLGQGDRSPIHAEGKHVIVIGGGDTGADCVGTAHRQGARSVTSLAIGRRPGETRSPSQPWPLHPTLFEVSSSHEEGGERSYLASTVAFIGDDEGRVRALSVAETGFTEGGREPILGTERLLDADLVLIALGFTGPDALVDPQFPIGIGRRSTYARKADFSALRPTEGAAGAADAAASDGFETLPGVFIAGDAGRGQSLIVWAIAEGRAAAAAVDTYLMGSTVLPAPLAATASAFA